MTIKDMDRRIFIRWGLFFNGAIAAAPLAAATVGPVTESITYKITAISIVWDGGSRKVELPDGTSFEEAQELLNWHVRHQAELEKWRAGNYVEAIYTGRRSTSR